MNNKSPVLWLALVAALAPTVALADLKSDLLAREQEMWIGWGKKDAGPYSKYLDADYRFVAENAAPIVGKEANVNALKSHSCELGAISFEDVTVRQPAPTVGVLGYTAIADIRCGAKWETLQLVVTAVWHQSNGSWTTSHYHQSLISN
ncbi:hypothetical protein HNQ60_000036 [Povalibacter uvarum]|uniref:DUF4440 domain-containing protein n=1 Tax=Povalibacter uvarum TaxID=732238 RepID=A0A841HFR1_9GAMM|nr:nuclear transport factor 2 family protein [Povalibacter uvarum]MBB6091190.1 hypothetical protein [Povalibacter uvarum]